MPSRYSRRCEAVADASSLLYGASKLETVFYVLNAEAKRVARLRDGSLTEQDAIFSQEFAWECINNLCDIATAVGMDQGDLWLACKYRAYHSDLEDNILLAAAKRSQADYLITWDEKLLRDAPALVRTVTPTTMLTVLSLQ